MLAHFFSFWPIERENQRMHIPTWLKRWMEIDVFKWLLSWFQNCFLSLILFGSHNSSCRRAHTPLFSLPSSNEERSFSWAFASLGLALSFRFVFFLVFCGGAFIASSTRPLMLWAFSLQSAHQSWSNPKWSSLPQLHHFSSPSWSCISYWPQVPPQPLLWA